MGRDGAKVQLLVTARRCHGWGHVGRLGDVAGRLASQVARQNLWSRQGDEYKKNHPYERSLMSGEKSGYSRWDLKSLLGEIGFQNAEKKKK